MAGGRASVSVVIPVWNEADRLPRLLGALERCRPAPLEVVVVDGGSTDRTRELTRGRARLLTAPRGRAAQQCVGAHAARGDALWFLHADSVPAHGAIGEIAAALEAGAPGGCFRIVFPTEERRCHPLLPVIERGINARTRLTRTGTGDQGIFIGRDLFEQLGGFPPWPLFEDVGLFRGLKATGRPAIARGPLETSARRWLAHGVIRTMVTMWALRLGFAAGVSPERLARFWRGGGAPA
ncbi:MAG TPA: TIGR04283 family arsenosugar biosynthesis glycosyltransferase [Gemmatimonadota bacterium]|nr:TIGR04283 family arsenosugar biosynthesis glycosyltransferase [Gemmatimonadota bacterium]